MTLEKLNSKGFIFEFQIKSAFCSMRIEIHIEELDCTFEFAVDNPDAPLELAIRSGIFYFAEKNYPGNEQHFLDEDRAFLERVRRDCKMDEKGKSLYTAKIISDPDESSLWMKAKLIDIRPVDDRLFALCAVAVACGRDIRATERNFYAQRTYLLQRFGLDIPFFIDTGITGSLECLEMRDYLDALFFLIGESTIKSVISAFSCGTAHQSVLRALRIPRDEYYYLHLEEGYSKQLFNGLLNNWYRLPPYYQRILDDIIGKTALIEKSLIVDAKTFLGGTQRVDLTPYVAYMLWLREHRSLSSHDEWECMLNAFSSIQKLVSVLHDQIVEAARELENLIAEPAV